MIFLCWHGNSQDIQFCEFDFRRHQKNEKIHKGTQDSLASTGLLCAFHIISSILVVLDLDIQTTFSYW